MKLYADVDFSVSSRLQKTSRYLRCEKSAHGDTWLGNVFKSRNTHCFSKPNPLLLLSSDWFHRLSIKSQSEWEQILW